MTDKPKPREWWIDGVSLIKENHEPYMDDEWFRVIHVVEYNAYDALAKQVEQLKTEDNKMVARLHRQSEIMADLDKEIDRLKRIIAKELSENDELGAEYTYVLCLKENIEELTKENTQLKEQLAVAEKERDGFKRRGDGHWETLKSILKMNDIEQIKQWVRDSASGYIQSNETTLFDLQSKLTTAVEALERITGARSVVGDWHEELAIEALSKISASSEARSEKGDE